MNEIAYGDGQDSGNPLAGAGSTARPDPLTELEQRWEKLAKGIQDLRAENAALWEQVQEREGQVTRLEQELTARTAAFSALQEEQQRTEQRIGGLLARFDEIGQ
ncbi:MAG: cell division protein ZapB [Magnetococcus sp. MYC-9]